MRNKVILSIIFLLGILSSCTDKFTEYNTDTKHPQEVTASVLVTNAQIDLADQISSTNVNDNIWKLMAQYWTERSYTDESNYNIVNRRIADGTWQTYYAILKDLKDAKSIINAEKLEAPDLAGKQANQANRLAIIDMLDVFIYQRLVDIFGNIPYKEALDPNNYTPAYDDAQTIYKDLIKRATEDVAALDDSQGSFGTADLIYNGDVTLWKEFGSSLMVKLGIGVADGPLSDLGKSTVEAAYSGVFTSLSDGAYFPYQKSLPYVNPLYIDLVASGRHDFIIPNTIWDVMDSLSDPRINKYFEDTDGIITAYGEKAGSYSSKVHYNSSISAPDFHGFLLTYDEVQFYLAEAAARGWNVGSTTAEEHFNEGVTSSIEEWGGTDTEASDFLTAHPYSSYTNWKDAIGTQAWVAMYTRGFIGYTFFRRLDYPAFNMPPNPPTGVDVIPTRFTYPINEQTLNAANYKAASDAIGGDLLTTKLFWDIN